MLRVNWWICIGKSVTGCKLAAFSSCGVPSVFRAAEAIHGDLGVYQPRSDVANVA